MKGKLHKLGWRHKMALRDGIAQAYTRFVGQLEAGVAVRS